MQITDLLLLLQCYIVLFISLICRINNMANKCTYIKGSSLHLRHLLSVQYIY